MRDDQFRSMTLIGGLPLRLDVEQVAWLPNCQSHDIPILVRARLIKPLGNPPANARKLFAADEVLELSRDKMRLSKVSNAIHDRLEEKQWLAQGSSFGHCPGTARDIVRRNQKATLGFSK